MSKDSEELEDAGPREVEARISVPPPQQPPVHTPPHQPHQPPMLTTVPVHGVKGYAEMVGGGVPCPLNPPGHPERGRVIKISLWVDRQFQAHPPRPDLFWFFHFPVRRVATRLSCNQPGFWMSQSSHVVNPQSGIRQVWAGGQSVWAMLPFGGERTTAFPVEVWLGGANGTGNSDFFYFYTDRPGPLVFHLDFTHEGHWVRWDGRFEV